jgi:hypothetical protein
VRWPSWKEVRNILGALAALAAIITFIQVEFGGSGHTPSGASSSTTAPALSSPSPNPQTTVPPKLPPASTPSLTYQRVSFLTLCNAPGVNTHFFGCGQPIVDQVGDHVENWDAQANANIQSQTEMTFPQTSCRSLILHFGFNGKLDYGPANGVAPPGLQITVTVAQSGSPPKSDSVKTDEVGSLHVKLSGGPWDISTMANQPNSGAWNIYLSGYASCTNASGVA